jgi:hypothetical protein
MAARVELQPVARITHIKAERFIERPGHIQVGHLQTEMIDRMDAQGSRALLRHVSLLTDA